MMEHARELRKLAVTCLQAFAASKGVKPVQCWLGVYVSDEQKLITFASMRDDLADVCGASGIEFLIWAREFPPAAMVGDGIAVLPFMPQASNCPRCRKSHGIAGNTNNLCDRCADVVAGLEVAA